MYDVSSEQLPGAIRLICERLITNQRIVKDALSNLGLAISHRSGSFWISTNFWHHAIEGKLLDAFLAHNFEFASHEGTMRLVDKVSKGFWNFKIFKPILYLAVSAVIDLMERGTVLRPRVFGTTNHSTTNDDSRLRVFDVVAQHTSNSPSHSINPVIAGIVSGHGKLVVEFQSIHLAGVRNLVQLFEEFANCDEQVKALAKSEESPFKPIPFSIEGEGPQYLTESDQRILFGIWLRQLENYKAKLVP